MSLATKCLVLFGGATVLIVLAALTFPWFRMTSLIDQGQLELSRQMAATWDHLDRQAAAAEVGNAPAVTPAEPGAEPTPSTAVGPELETPEFARPVERGGVVARRLSLDEATAMAESDRFIRRALRSLQSNPDRYDFQDSQWSGTSREYRYAMAERSARAGAPTLASLIVLERRSVEATRMLLFNTLYLVVAGAAVLVLALIVFYILTQKLVLEPVLSLERTAERVREGNLSTRATISTGDEFQQLADTFNSMLNDLQSSQDRLRGINAALDLKLNELTETNSVLYQTAKVKGEFLANVSHELRTPLNSIIGFAELLMEVAKADVAKGQETPALQKRMRYLDNILTAGRNLLSMINTLLEMAKIEAGRVELAVDMMNVRDVCEALAGLIYPLAERKQVAVKVEVADEVPLIRTDPKKFQQIVFNFLSNAVKFIEPIERTGRVPQITLRAERLVPAAAGDEERVRVSVIDNGPGIPTDEQDKIFDKFYQLNGGHTREHAGTGLGLAICKELATILHAQIQLVSEPGRGSMFSIIMPIAIDEDAIRETALESRFRGSLAGRREFNEAASAEADAG